MKVLIIEDELSAYDNLKYLLGKQSVDMEVEDVIDNVKDAVDYFRSDPQCELVFMDIHLADGISFEIFEQVEVKIPIIFTTAYDQYAIQAFKVHSIDYLLKPLDVESVAQALDKYEDIRNQEDASQKLRDMILDLMPSKRVFKKTYLVQQRDKLIPLNVNDVAYFLLEASIVKAYTFDQKGYILDKKLDEIEAEVNPSEFFRATRQLIVQRSAIENMQVYFQGKLILNVKPELEERIIMSKAKSRELKRWMNEMS
ncbi:response regulator transcription factor [bacterium SCSIO 12643]|nr:response regulator transcription factor [bacterium SCSIO 12643]